MEEEQGPVKLTHLGLPQHDPEESHPSEKSAQFLSEPQNLGAQHSLVMTGL